MLIPDNIIVANKRVHNKIVSFYYLLDSINLLEVHVPFAKIEVCLIGGIKGY